MFLDVEKHGMIFKKDQEIQKGKFYKNTIYNLDGVASPLMSQQETYQMIAAPILKNIMTNQINTGMIFAYGYTNSGKTYSVLGDTQHISQDENAQVFFNRDSIGILPRILSKLIQSKMQNLGVSAEEKWVSEIKINAFEIYQEKVFDLLILKDSKKSGKEKYPLHQTKKFNQLENHHGKYIFTQQRILNLDDAFKVLRLVETNRSVDNNGVNVKSSRSHTVFKIEFFCMKYKEENTENIFNKNINQIDEISKTQNNKSKGEIKSIKKEIMIIDLAGAERPNPDVQEEENLNWHITNAFQKSQEGKKSVQFKSNSKNNIYKSKGTKSASKSRFHSQIRKPKIATNFNFYPKKGFYRCMC
jgi:hypothetical protein